MTDREDKQLVLSPEQLAVARCLLLVERLLEPRCEECGFGVRRPKCAHELGGNCLRREQKDSRAFELVRERMRCMLGDVPYDWRHRVALHLLHDFSEKERCLLLDLADAGGRQETRSQDTRFDGLSSKGAVSLSVQHRWRVELTRRGRDLVEMWRAEQAVPAA